MDNVSLDSLDLDSDADGEIREPRRRQRTEKGREYIAHLRWRDCQLIGKKIQRQIKEINSLSNNVENVTVIEGNLSSFRITVEEFKGFVAALLRDLDTDEELSIANDWYAEQNKCINDFIEKTVLWISSAKDSIEQNLEERSQVSSKHTHASRRSQASSRPSITTRRAKERAKAAELMTRVAMLERKQELEKTAEKLRLEEQLAVAQVRERVFAEIEDGAESDLRPRTTTPLETSRAQATPISGSEFPPLSVTLATPASFTTPPTFSASATFTNPSVSSTFATRASFTTPVALTAPSLSSIPAPNYAKGRYYVPEVKIPPKPAQQIQFCDVLQEQNRLTRLLAEQQQRSLLPSLTLTKFTGNPLEYSTFIRSFESQVEARVSANDVRLQYLEQYLGGEPKDLIKGCLHLDHHSGFEEAKRLLEEKYGDPYKISNAYIKRINEWPCIRAGDDRTLDRFSVFLTQCRSAMSTLTFLSILDHPHNLQSMVTKLPFYLQDRWRREANKKRVAGGEIPTFTDFVSFVKAEAGIATDPVFSREALRRLDSTSERSDRSNRGKGSGRTRPPGNRTRDEPHFASHATDVTADRRTADVRRDLRNSISLCKLCGRDHDLDDCQAYLKKTLSGRKEFLRVKGLCSACYEIGHRSNGCAQRRTCKRCLRRHPTGLHDDNFRPTQPDSERQSLPHVREERETVDASTETEAACNATDAGNSVSAVPIVPVRVRSPLREVLTYAMLDTCSTGTFLLEDLAVSLGVTGSDTQLVVKTVNGTKSHNAKVLNGLVVTDLNGSNAVQLPKTYTREDLISCENVPSPEIAFKWKHLERIAGDIPPPLLDARIGLLIGTNCPKALEPIDVLASEDGGPFAIKTFAGWAVVGPLYMSNKEHQMVDCNRIAAEEVGTNRHLEHHFMVENRVKEIVTPQALNMLLEQDFSERIGDKDQEYSLEDKKFLKIVNRKVRRTEDGHYEIPLPFRCDVPSFPENRQQILERMEWLKRKISKSEKIHEDYTTFMNGIIAQGFASRVPPDRLTTKPGRVWFIPHHCVYHAKKPNKIRVVFDCSARFGGVSLNDQLIQGPDLTNRLVGVLTRFRQGPIAFMGDIDAMFHQVRVPDSHRDFLRFLWWPEGDLTQDLEEYQMNVHLFGAVSSPSSSNFALLKAADDTEKVVGSETADVLRRNFYVDDCLRCEETEDFAIQRIRGVRDACAHGGFNLAKFVSNSRTVLESVPEEARAQNVKSLELSNSILSVERALGVQWAIESDTFGFRIILKDQPLTRRGILSTVSSVYDPLGIAAPVLLVGKQILQDLCRRKQGWDEEVDEEFRARWKNWKSQLPALERFSMERCLKPTNFGTVVSRQVHSFSDASSTGYGQVSYLRIENEKGDVHCAFLMGKARVAPVKAMTIPRLELTAATVSVRVGEMIANELDEPVESKTYWTDSTTVLKYVRNEKKRFHVFVANRVQAIREATSPEQWKYVESKVNPADDASRGLKGYELSKEHRWITGPNFLWLPESEWPQIPYDLGVSADDPEIKRVQVHSLVIDESSDLLKRLTRFSDWRYMKRSVAWMLRLANKESHTVPDKAANKAEDFAKLKEKPIRVDEVEKAETAILKVVQKSAFPTEIEALKKIKREDCENDRHYEKSKKHEIKKSSVLYRLDPFLDQNGLLRVGGRLSKSQEFPEDFKHPVILPKRSSVVNLIVRDAHKKVAHAGRGITLSELRSQYWIVNANSVVRHFISKCIVCRRLRGTSGEQKMAVLPRERITPSPPFTYCGVDYFGPFFIKQGRKEVKRYGAIFTCLASRAVHIETAESLETDSFINALRRFIARRGPVREIRSDQGTNIVGAANELKKALEEMDHSVIQRSLCRGFKADWIIRWKKNPPAASHMGGVWERQIRSIRSILSALLKEFGHCLNDETFRTLLTEVECILNSRPLTVPSSDPDDLNPLTPNHILTMKSRVVMPPPGNFQKADVYLRKRWKRVQYLSNVFWSRWRKEYVQSLQQRVKWNRPRRNLQSGDLVLIVDDRVARNKWNLARVVDTNPDSDGQVRSVRVATATTTLDRPIDKLVLIMENEE